MEKANGKVLGAAEKYMKMDGCEVLERDFEGFMVARDCWNLVFARVVWTTGDDFIDGIPERKEFEDAACKYLAEYDDADFRVRCDVVSMRILREDGALIRHCWNALEM